MILDRLLTTEPHGICRVPVVLESFWAPDGLGQYLGDVKPLSGSRWQVHPTVLGIAEPRFKDRPDLDVFFDVRFEIGADAAKLQPCGPVLRYRDYRYVLIVPSELLDRDFMLFAWEFDNLRSPYHDHREVQTSGQSAGQQSPAVQERHPAAEGTAGGPGGSPGSHRGLG